MQNKRGGWRITNVLGLYQNPRLTEWFVGGYKKTALHKIDMGKSRVRLIYFEEIPFDLIGELTKKIDVQEWIRIYEKEIKGKERL